MATRIGDGRHHVAPGGDFIASRSAFVPALEVFARALNPTSYPVHVHDRWQLTWVLGGCVQLVFRGGSCLLRAGDVILAAPFEPIGGRVCEGGPFGFVTLQIPHELLRERRQRGVIARRGGAAICHRLLETLVQARSAEDHRDALIESSDAIASTDCVTLASERTRLHPAVGRARALLEDPGEGARQLSELADAIRLHEHYIIALFKSEIGVPPHQYVMARRVERARKLLNEGRALNAVAAECGFNDQSHLTRDFKRTFGVTPGAYQAHHCQLNFLQNFPPVAA
jgi:AraC-like DNA-binding protein